MTYDLARRSLCGLPSPNPAKDRAMLTIGDQLPSYSLQAVVSRDPGKEFATLTNQSHSGK